MSEKKEWDKQKATIKYRKMSNFYIVKNWFKGKWVFHYFPKNLPIMEMVLNEHYSFYKLRSKIK